MQIEHSPIAQTVMQARMQRLTEHVPAIDPAIDPTIDPTLRLEAAGGRRNYVPQHAAHGRAGRNKMAAGLAFMAFVGTIGVLKMRASKQEPTATTPLATAVTSAEAGRKYLLNAPAAVEAPARPLEILPVEPAPETPKQHPVQSARGVHIAAAAPVIHRANPLPHAAPAHHAVSSRLSAAPPVYSHRSVAAAQTQTSGIRVEPSDNSVRDLQTVPRFHAASAANTITASAEVKPDNSSDPSENKAASLLRTPHRRHSHRYSAEADERRSYTYKYGENARRPFNYDAKFARHPTSGYNEKADAWIDKLPQ